MSRKLHIRALAAMDMIDGAVVNISQICLACMVLITFISVIGRTFFNTSIPDDLLMQEMLMVAIVFLPLSYVQSVGAHLEVTVITDQFPERIQSFFITLGLVLGILAFGGMTWLAAGEAYGSYQSGEIAYASVLDIPEWPVKSLIPLGLFWWCVRMFIQLLPSARPDHDETEFDQVIEETRYLSDAPESSAVNKSATVE